MLVHYTMTPEGIVESREKESPILVFVNPDEKEKHALVGEYQIEEHMVQSALDPEELSRLQFELGYAAVIFKVPKNYSARDHYLFKVSTVGAFLFKDRLILVVTENIDLFASKLFLKCASLQDVLLKLLYQSISHFLGHLKAINMISDELEKKINKAMENKYLINLFTLEKSLVFYLNAINTNGALIEKIKTNEGKLGLTPEQSEFVGDINIENTQCCRQAEVYSNILASLMDARVSIVSNNLNLLIKFLNIITIGIMVPTLVVSIFSMNVTLPLQGHPAAFWLIVSLALVSVFGVFLSWKYFKW
ncbi:MAG: magnesium transporter CorA family protein [Candidatus Aureabacteria bacterium]|nr:magnesium transporter CorA family protein [Candidatus Auribacterota bacterium]